MQSLSRKMSDLAVEHSKAIEEYQRLKSELETIRHGEDTKGKVRGSQERADAEMYRGKH
jgi:hypothetical protein